MMPFVLVTTFLLGMLLTTAFLLGRHLSRRQYLRSEMSAVTRQHLDLVQGGHLSESAVEATKARFRDLLERGQVEMVEASMRPGTHYVVQVRALAELGTEDAGDILERQLQRKITEDSLEQSWYWIDLANGLRSLNREESLPELLRCAERACDFPLGHLFAAETVCFLGFRGYLRETRRSPLNRIALRVLHRALEGAHYEPHFVLEARLGEMIETLWDYNENRVDPLVMRVYFEALRILRRAQWSELSLQEELPDLEAFRWQISRLSALETPLRDHLLEGTDLLLARLPNATPKEQQDVLRVLTDLRVEAGETLLPLVKSSSIANTELAVDLLRWSDQKEVGDWLRQRALTEVPLLKRSQKRKRPTTPKRASVSSSIPYEALLRALRGHGSRPTEALLLLAARDWDPLYRMAAVSSLGWWEPFQREDTMVTLQDARRDSNPDVRLAARSALARLGERQALQWFRQTMVSEDLHRVHETIHLIAQEGLTLLWPELDRLADAEDLEVAHHARESLARLSEELEFGM